MHLCEPSIDLRSQASVDASVDTDLYGHNICVFCFSTVSASTFPRVLSWTDRVLFLPKGTVFLNAMTK